MLSLIATAATTDSAETTEGVDTVVDGVTRLSGLMSNHGILIVVISAVLIIFFVFAIGLLINNYRMINNIIKTSKINNSTVIESLDKFTNSSTNANNVEMKKTVEEFKKSIKKSINQANTKDLKNKNNSQEDYHKNIVGAYINVSMAFKDASRAALNKIGCDRIAIYTFHNGNVSMYGLPFFKMSCIHEWTKTGVNTLRGKSHTDLPLHLFSDFIEDLWKNGEYISEDIEKSQVIDHSIKEFIAYSETKSLYITAVKNFDDIIVGFIIAEFDHVETFETDQKRHDEIKEAMDEMSLKVSPILGSEYVYKNPVNQKQ